VLCTSSGVDGSSRAAAFISYLGRDYYGLPICKTLWGLGLGCITETAPDLKDAFIRVDMHAKAAQRAE
jgi:hypothetical protein